MVRLRDHASAILGFLILQPIVSHSYTVIQASLLHVFFITLVERQDASVAIRNGATLPTSAQQACIQIPIHSD